MGYCTFRKIVITSTAVIAFGIVIFSLQPEVSKAIDVALDGRVVGCGDGIIDVGESCDLSNMNGQSCTTLGFTGGTLYCTATCTYDTSVCTLGGGGGGGGGGSSRTSSARSLVAFSGIAAPFSVASLLVDGTLNATTTADQLGRFTFTARNLAPGVYTMHISAQDIRGHITAPRTITTEVKNRSVLYFTDIFLSPTVQSDNSSIRQGEQIRLYGTTIPQGQVFTYLYKQDVRIGTGTVQASVDGTYEFIQETASLPYGTYSMKVLSVQAASTSATSTPLEFTVGTTTTPSTDTCQKKGDLNKDCRVNLIDVSILFFWFKTTLSPAVTALEQERLSGDGRVDFTDFSIMLHFWTG